VKTGLLFVSLLAFLPQEPKTLTLNEVDGESVTAQVLELKGDSAKLKVMILGGNMTVTRKLTDFAPLSIFRIEQSAKAPNDFDGHFALAKRAAELRLLTQAGSEARLAVESVKDATQQEAKRAEVRKWAADALEAMTREAVAQNKIAEARHCLKLLSTRFADQRSEEQLDALAGEVAALDERVATERENARQAKLDAASRDKTKKTLGQVSEQLEKGDKLSREAITKSRTTVASTNLCEKAIDAYKAGWTKLQKVIESAGDDNVLANEAGALSMKLHDNAIRAALHAANMLTVQSDFKNAMEWANRILKFDPECEEAKEMVKTITIAAAAAGSDWGWGWSMPAVGGSRPVVDPRKN
jgi:tetratricopeptide (TPR) repeat protein